MTIDKRSTAAGDVEGRSIGAAALLPTAETVEIGVLLAIVGGFLDAYTFLTCGGVFANAQSGNVVLLGLEAAQGHFRQALRHLFPIVAFIAGVLFVEALRRPRVAALVRWPARVALILEISALVIVGLLWRSLPSGVVVVLIAFVASVQISAFKTLRGWSYTSTMATGNLMSLTAGWFQRVVARDRQATTKAASFTLITMSFLLGALLGGVSCLVLGGHAIWVPIVILIATLVLFVIDDRPRPRLS
ncbi:YoaK family protein [Nocardia sp. NPDC127526]|uniref:YoaK family protein n=1 Tax=Nocardia sp. NPDC127526 TaxID=3345393 RepID=UPI00362ACCA2